MRLSYFFRCSALALLMLPLFTNAASLEVGGNHSCALTSTGGVQCWGLNGSGQLGDGTTTQRDVPVAVNGLNSGVQGVATGEFHSCALTTAGSVHCWGRNAEGQLGDGTTTNRWTPVAVSGLSSGVQMIAVGLYHSCALMMVGGVQCWGSNASGKLGDGTTTTRLTPVEVSGLASGVQAIAMGGSHMCVLTTTGVVQCWGGNGSGQLGDGTTTSSLIPVAVGSLSDGVRAIVAGVNHTCALTEVDGVQCWGQNNRSQLGDGTTTNRLTPVAVSGLSSGVQAIAAGASHSCALTMAGGVQCWGYNFNGQLGDGTKTNRATPVAVVALNGDVQALSAGGVHTCALTATGGVRCWGWNLQGQLGDGTAVQSLTPVSVSRWGQVITVVTSAPELGMIGDGFPVDAFSSSGLPVSIIATGGCSVEGNTLTITSATPFCTVTYTQAGNAEYAPTTVSSITSVDTDGDGTANAADTDDDNDGILDIFDAVPLDPSDSLDADFDGVGNIADTDDDNDTVQDGSDNCPLRANLEQIDSNADGQGDICEPPAIALGGSYTCALTATGGVQCWGSNGTGQLGDGTQTERRTPVAVSGLSSGVQTIAAGANHACALTTVGGVQCWGDNYYGQLGDNTTTRRLTPVAVIGLSSGVQAIAAGEDYTCALTAAGGVQCWGDNQYGRLGDGTTTKRLTPVTVVGLSSGIQAITADGSHTCALTTLGGVQCWGYNSSGQLGDGTTTTSLTPVEVSGLGGGVREIVAGWNYTCALTAGSGVQCWGYNENGQLGDGSTTKRLTPVTVVGLSSGVQAITAGGYHTCALTSLGSVYCWGYNSNGQLGDGTTTQRLAPVEVAGFASGVQAITAGSYHTCVLTMLGGVKCWGDNVYGQIGDGTTTPRLIPVDVLRDGDGDGVLDASDAFPLNPAESVDTDHDGIGNNADADDDDDGIPDAIDPQLQWVPASVNGAYQGSSIQESAAPL